VLSKMTLALALAITAITISVPARALPGDYPYHQATRTALTTEMAGNAAILRSNETATRVRQEEKNDDFAIIAVECPALVAGSGNRDNEYKSSQYCVPQDDIPGAQRVYC
jgi:hypothetical protein